MSNQPAAAVDQSASPADSIIAIGLTVANNTKYTLYLDTGRSSGIDTSVWPATISPYTTTTQFTQDGTFQVKFDAWYNAGGSNPPESVDFVGYWTAGWQHDTEIKPSPSTAFQGSTVSYTNSSGTYNLNGQ
jgi:hypothetical protein